MTPMASYSTTPIRYPSALKCDCHSSKMRGLCSWTHCLSTPLWSSITQRFSPVGVNGNSSSSNDNNHNQNGDNSISIIKYIIYDGNGCKDGLLVSVALNYLMTPIRIVMMNHIAERLHFVFNSFVYSLSLSPSLIQFNILIVESGGNHLMHRHRSICFFSPLRTQTGVVETIWQLEPTSRCIPINNALQSVLTVMMVIIKDGLRFFLLVFSLSFSLSMPSFNDADVQRCPPI